MDSNLLIQARNRSFFLLLHTFAIINRIQTTKHKGYKGSREKKNYNNNNNNQSTPIFHFFFHY